MGCNTQAGGRQVDLPKNLIIHGNVVDKQTRSIMAACAISGQALEFNMIDTFAGANKTKRYLEINPTGHIPMIEDG